MASRIPKDIEKYITPWLAATRMIHFAVASIACKPRGVRVKWELKIRFYYPPECLKDSSAPCVALGGTVTSGEEVEELTGNEPMRKDNQR